MAWLGGHGAFRLDLVRFGWARRFWLGLDRCATDSHGVAVEMWKVAISYGLGW